LDLIAFEGVLSAAEEGVYAAAVVVAFEPADDDPEDAKDEDAPAQIPRGCVGLDIQVLKFAGLS